MQENTVDTEELNEKVEKILEIVGMDVTHRVMTEWLNKASASARKQFGDAVLAMIPRVAHDAMYAKLRSLADVMADELLRALRPKIEAQVRAELDKQSSTIAAEVAERVKQRAPMVADNFVLDLVRDKFRAR